MFLQLMRLQIHLGRESNELLFQARLLLTRKVIFPHMRKQRLIIEIVLRLTSMQLVTNKAPLMLLPAMHIQLILTIKPQSTERTQRMALEPRLIDRTGIVVSFPHMFL